MRSRPVTGAIAAAAVLAGLAASSLSAGAPVAMREIVHIQAVATPVGVVPAHDGTIIVEN